MALKRFVPGVLTMMSAFSFFLGFLAEEALFCQPSALELPPERRNGLGFHAVSEAPVGMD